MNLGSTSPEMRTLRESPFRGRGPSGFTQVSVHSTAKPLRFPGFLGATAILGVLRLWDAAAIWGDRTLRVSPPSSALERWRLRGGGDAAAAAGGHRGGHAGGAGDGRGAGARGGLPHPRLGLVWGGGGVGGEGGGGFGGGGGEGWGRGGVGEGRGGGGEGVWGVWGGLKVWGFGEVTSFDEWIGWGSLGPGRVWGRGVEGGVVLGGSCWCERCRE